MLYAVDDETYVELARRVFLSKFEWLESEAVALVVVVRVKNYVDGSFYGLDYVAFSRCVGSIYRNGFKQSLVADTENVAVKRTSFLRLDIGSLQIKRYLLVYRKKVGESNF